MASVEVASPRGADELTCGFDPTWGATFTWARYEPSTGCGARHHCVFCWVSFVEPGVPDRDARVEGYWSSAPGSERGGDHSLWVCGACFHEHKDEFAWHVGPANLC